MEPLSLIAISAAVGGATGKFVEKAWDSGEKWISTFYKDHQELAQNKATENTKDFLQELAQRIKFLEESMQVSKENIDLALANDETKNQAKAHAYKARIMYGIYQYNLKQEIKKLEVPAQVSRTTVLGVRFAIFANNSVICFGVKTIPKPFLSPPVYLKNSP